MTKVAACHLCHGVCMRVMHVYVYVYIAHAMFISHTLCLYHKRYICTISCLSFHATKNTRVYSSAAFSYYFRILILQCALDIVLSDKHIQTGRHDCFCYTSTKCTIPDDIAQKNTCTHKHTRVHQLVHALFVAYRLYMHTQAHMQAFISLCKRSL
jgi:hypothetical protein